MKIRENVKSIEEICMMNCTVCVAPYTVYFVIGFVILCHRAHVKMSRINSCRCFDTRNRTSRFLVN